MCGRDDDVVRCFIEATFKHSLCSSGGKGEVERRDDDDVYYPRGRRPREDE